MDVVIYVGIAVLLAVILFVGFGKKKDEAEGRAVPPPSPERKPGEPKADKALADRPPPPKHRDKAKEKAPEPVTPESKPAARVADEAPKAEERELESAPAREAPVPPSSRKPSEPPAPPSEKRPRKVEVLRQGLSKSRQTDGLFGKLKALFGRKVELSPELAAEIEEVLLASDVGVSTTTSLLSSIRERLGKGELSDPDAVWAAVRARASEMLQTDGAATGLRLSHKPTVVLLVGVNGAGKTTTIGKLATQLQANGKKCVLAAGDTFRAAAVQQLVVWGERVGCEVVKGKDGADPGSVIFDAIQRAQQVGADVVLADTAGRLHTKSNLMAEMQKITRTVGKAMEGAPHETLLVIDSTNGQNALAQATEFKQKLDLTGIVLTKLDGTAKGGVVLGIASGLQLPVRFIGLGERPDDLHEFIADDFVEALLGNESEDE
jgi:fused signal recognition particle receptor